MKESVMLKRLFLAGCIVFCLAGRASAAHPLVTDDTGTQGRGRYSLELSGEVAREKERLGTVTIREREAAITASFSAGLTDTIDLVAGLPWAWNINREDGRQISDDKGFADLSLELKWRFYDNGSFSLAVKPGVTLPSGNEEKGLGSGTPSYGVTLMASRDFAPFAVHLNAGYSRNEYVLDADRDANRSNIWYGSLAVTFDVTKNLQMVADIGMESNGHRSDSSWPGFVLAGFIYAVTENLLLDVGVKEGFHSQEKERAVLAGVAYSF
jgi:hypothetical protein